MSIFARSQRRVPIVAAWVVTTWTKTAWVAFSEEAKVVNTPEEDLNYCASHSVAMPLQDEKSKSAENLSNEVLDNYTPCPCFKSFVILGNHCHYDKELGKNVCAIYYYGQAKDLICDKKHMPRYVTRPWSLSYDLLFLQPSHSNSKDYFQPSRLLSEFRKGQRIASSVFFTISWRILVHHLVLRQHQQHRVFAQRVSVERPSFICLMSCFYRKAASTTKVANVREHSMRFYCVAVKGESFWGND